MFRVLLDKGGLTMRNLLAGLLIGIGCILPGISGGVMAVSFGLYRPMLDAVSGLLNDPRRHLRFLVPLGLAIAAGIALGAVGLAGVMSHYERPMLFVFTGFILGSVPDLLHQADQQERFRPQRLWSLFAGVALALPLSLFASHGIRILSLSPIQAFLTGILEGIGTVIPGVSTSLVLIHLGWYQAYLTALSTLNIETIFPLAAGFALSALGCIRFVKWLFDRHPGHAFYAVLGFLLVSVALVFPGFSRGWTWVAEAGMLLCGILLSRRLSTLES